MINGIPIKIPVNIKNNLKDIPTTNPEKNKTIETGAL